MIRETTRLNEGLKISNETYRQDPVNRNGEDFTDAQQVDKCPKDGGDKGRNCHKQEEMCGAEKGWWGSGHTDDSENL